MRKYSKTVWMPGGSMGQLAAAIELDLDRLGLGVQRADDCYLLSGKLS